MKTQVRFITLLAVLATAIIAAPALAGSLDAPGTPPMSSGMPTTADIYNRLTSGAAISVPNTFQEPVAGPTAGTGKTLSEIAGKLPTPDNSNGAVAADVANGKAFWGLRTDGTWGLTSGAMANNGTVTITPGTSAQTIAAGYHNGAGNVAGDSNLLAGNIKSGVSIFGVSGSLSALGWAHVARAICTPGWGGTNCDVCAGQWSGASCDVCPIGWSGVNCDIIAKPFPSSVPSYASTPWKCVADSASGLTWAIKTLDGGLHDRNNTYTWYYSNDADPGTATAGSCVGTRGCDTAKYVVAVNDEKLCGYADWRLPSPSELRGPLFAGTPQAINLDYFPNEQASSIHWSGSSYVPDPSFAWGVNFNGGSVNAYVKTDDHYVRLVRGGP